MLAPSARSVLITGAGSGIGRATALKFGALGDSVMCADIDPDSAAETARLIRSAGGDAASIRCDVSQEDDVRAMVDATVERWGSLGVAFNNAAIRGAEGPLMLMQTADFDRVMDVNLRSVFLCMREELRVMTPHRRGAIINTSSVSAISNNPSQGAYGAAKAAVVTLTKVAAMEHARLGIRINAIAPAATRTAMVEEARRENPELVEATWASSPIGRPADPDEQAAAVVWLASDEASFVLGHLFPVDGGQTAGRRAPESLVEQLAAFE